MKNLLFLLIFISCELPAQTFIAKENSSADQSAVLQNAFNNPAISTVLINAANIIINGTVNIPEGKILKFDAGCKLSGKGIINGGIIEANYHTQIFDTALTVNPKAVDQYFSVDWFGAKGNGSNDYAAIQTSINTCIRNNIRTVFLPVGTYKISNPLIICTKGNIKQGGFCTLELLGESSFWDANTGSEINPTFSNAFAIGIQNGKGCKIRKLKITGLFTPPYSGDQQKFYNCSFENFTDGVCRDSRYSPYAAIVIDPFTNLSANKIPADGGYPGLNSYYGSANNFTTQTGSTGIEIEELSINNFVVGICSSPNGLTRNAEITIINKVQFENCKLCISGGQDQEKDNTVSNIYCWGGTHTIFATGLYGGSRMAGNWNIDHANIAGAVVRFIFNDQHGYFPTYISNVFAESLGQWGTINSELACEISDCHIDFAYPEEQHAGIQTLITSWGENIVYRSCNFRYYGKKTPMKIEGNCTFDHCYFSGSIEKGNINFINSFFKLKKADPSKFFAEAALTILSIFVLGFCIFYYRGKKNWKVVGNFR